MEPKQKQNIFLEICVPAANPIKIGAIVNLNLILHLIPIDVIALITQIEQVLNIWILWDNGENTVLWGYINGNSGNKAS